MDNTGNETGSSLFFIIIAILVFGILGSGMFHLFTTSTVSVFTPNYALKARYMAEAGIRYAKGKMRSAADIGAAVAALNATEYAPEKGSGFTLNITGESSPYTIVSTGFSGAGTAASYMELTGNFTFQESAGGNSFSPVLFGGNGISIHGDASVTGDVITENSVEVGGSGQLTGNVNAGGGVKVTGAGKVDGDIVSGGDVQVSGSGNVTGNIDALGNVRLTGNVLVAGDLNTRGDVVITGSSRVLGSINAGGRVDITGTSGVGKNIISGGDVVLKGGSVGGNVDAGGGISLGWSCSIGGNATAAGRVDYKERGDIGGTVSEQAASPPRLLPKEPEDCCDPGIHLPEILFTAGKKDIKPCGSGTPLAPGKYGVLKTDWSCKNIYLKPGKYYFEKIHIKDWSSCLYLDISDAADERGIEIFVVGDADFGSGFKVMVSTDGHTYKNAAAVDKDLAAHIYLETRGSFNMGPQGQWFGAVYSWERLRISKGQSRYIGSFYLKNLKNLEVNSDIDIVLVPSNYIRNNW